MKISISGAVFTSKGVMCDPFVTESLVYNKHNYQNCVRVARTLAAVTKAAKSLVTYYRNKGKKNDQH